MFNNIVTGAWGDIWTWLGDEDIQEKVFGIFLPDDEDDEDSDDPGYFEGYLSQFIKLPNKDVLVGIQPTSSVSPDGKSRSIVYVRLSDISALVYIQPDNKKEE